MAPTWLPLESNPEVLNPFLRSLGVPEAWAFCDVFGMDPELLGMVPRPCAALCLLFPCTKVAGPRRAELAAARAASGPSAAEASLFFAQQHDGCGNACGAIAAMHAAANAAASGAFALDAAAPLGRFVAETAGATPGRRGDALVGAEYLHRLSDATARAGATDGAGTDDAGDRHFIAFLVRGGRLWELDGRTVDENGAAFPVDHGACEPDAMVEAAAAVIRDQFMKRDPENLNFSVVALAKAE